MTSVRYITWFAFAFAWFALLFAVQYPIRKKSGVPVRILTMTIKLLLSFVIAYFIMTGTSMLLYRISFAAAALYAVMFADSVGDMLILFLDQIRNNLRHPEHDCLRLPPRLTPVSLRRHSMTLPFAVKNKKQSTVKLQLIVNFLCAAA